MEGVVMNSAVGTKNCIRSRSRSRSRNRTMPPRSVILCLKTIDMEYVISTVADKFQESRDERDTTPQFPLQISLIGSGHILAMGAFDNRDRTPTVGNRRSIILVYFILSEGVPVDQFAPTFR
jgi:hypothetical protein